MFYSTRWHRVKKKRRIAQCQTSSRFLICGITMKSCGILPGRSCFSAPKRSRTIDVVDIEESENNRAMRKLLALRTYCLNHSCGALCIIPAPLSRMFVTILDFAASVYPVMRWRLHRIFRGLSHRMPPVVVQRSKCIPIRLTEHSPCPCTVMVQGFSIVWR